MLLPLFLFSTLQVTLQCLNLLYQRHAYINVFNTYFVVKTKWNLVNLFCKQNFRKFAPNVVIVYLSRNLSILWLLSFYFFSLFCVKAMVPFFKLLLLQIVFSIQYFNKVKAIVFVSASGETVNVYDLPLRYAGSPQGNIRLPHIVPLFAICFGLFVCIYIRQLVFNVIQQLVKIFFRLFACYVSIMITQWISRIIYCFLPFSPSEIHRKNLLGKPIFKNTTSLPDK